MVTTHLFFLPIDVNECFYEELNACSERELCLNVEGSYQCVRHLEGPTWTPQRLNRTCEGKMHRTRVRKLFRLDGLQTTEICSSSKEEKAGSQAESGHLVL